MNNCEMVEKGLCTGCVGLAEKDWIGKEKCNTYKELKNVVEVYFTVDSTNEKKPDEYTTKVLDFSNESKDILMRFLEINLGRKYTRMKKKTK